MRGVRCWILASLSFGMLMFIVGCSTSKGDEPLTDEKKIAETIEQGESVESVMTFEVLFDDINDIEDIEIPDEVIEEAEQHG